MRRTVQPKDTVARRISDSGYECENTRTAQPKDTVARRISDSGYEYENMRTVTRTQ